MSFRKICLKILAILKNWLEKKNYYAYEGLRIPAPENRFCTDDLKADQVYLSSAIQYAEYLQKACALKSDSTVLDIGCGQGRLAFGLIKSLPELNAYYGLDTHRESIDWCKRHISSIHSNYRFSWVDVHNERYNPYGLPLNQSFQFPFKEESFDVIALYSVFTHMLSPDIVVYLKEMFRILKKGGSCFLTVFAEEDRPDETENPDDYLTELNPPKGPLHRVLFNKKYFSDMLEDAGFTIDEFVYQSEPVSKQSHYIVRKG